MKTYVFSKTTIESVEARSEEEARQKLQDRFAMTFDDFDLVDVRDA